MNMGDSLNYLKTVIRLLQMIAYLHDSEYGIAVLSNKKFACGRIITIYLD